MSLLTHFQAFMYKRGLAHPFSKSSSIMKIPMEGVFL